MTRILERVAHGDPFDEPAEADRDAAYATGAQGARAGIVPADLVAAILLGAGEVEADVLARAAAAGVGAETRLAASTRSRRWAEQVAVWASHGLLEAGRGGSERQVLEDQFVRAVREGLPAAAVQQQAAALGIDPQRDWFAVLALSAPTEDLAAVTALRLASPGGLWSAVIDGPDGLEICGLLPQSPRARVGQVIGVAGPTPLADAADTLIDAARAARVAFRFGLSGVHDLESLGLLVPLHEDPHLAARLVRRWIDPLVELARHELVPTLRSWLGHDGQIDLVAREHGVHANTVRNRLARIDTVLGGDWRNAGSRAAIWAALQVSGSNIVKISTE